MTEQEEISPASMPAKPILSWANSPRATNTEVIDDGNSIQFQSGGGFRYCRSEQEFTSGSYRFEIQIDFEGKDGQVSFGICHEPNLNCDAGVYYFTNAYIYCNYYPSFTKDYNNIHKSAPEKVKDQGTLAINFDLDSKKLFWEINGKEYEELDFDNQGRPIYVVVGMFSGKAIVI